MKLIDRISISRAMSMILDFILSVIKIFASNKSTDTDTNPRTPRRRKVKKDE